MSEIEEVRFVVDVMLGSLVRWLRRLGYDTDYRNYRDDPELVRVARAENRVLLTRDRDLSEWRGVSVLLIESLVLDKQLAQVTGAFPLPASASSRCSECNTLLLAASPEEVKGLVPCYIYETHEQFQCCPGCERIYWPGSHWRSIQAKLKQLREGQIQEI